MLGTPEGTEGILLGMEGTPVGTEGTEGTLGILEVELLVFPLKFLFNYYEKKICYFNFIIHTTSICHIFT